MANSADLNDYDNATTFPALRTGELVDVKPPGPSSGPRRPGRVCGQRRTFHAIALWAFRAACALFPRSARAGANPSKDVQQIDPRGVCAGSTIHTRPSTSGRVPAIQLCSFPNVEARRRRLATPVVTTSCHAQRLLSAVGCETGPAVSSGRSLPSRRQSGHAKLRARPLDVGLPWSPEQTRPTGCCSG
jgi:hypothetical protein